MSMNVFPIKNRDEVLVRCKPFIRLKTVFPHIGRKIFDQWGSIELSKYIQHVLTDTRGGTRKGFPPLAVEDLIRLMEYHERMFGEIIEQVRMEETKVNNIWGVAS